MKKYIEIVNFETGKVVRRIDVTGKSQSSVERIDDGININLNHNEYFTRENDSEETLPVGDV